MEGTATAAWIPYASATVGTRVRRRGVLNAVVRRRVCRIVILKFVVLGKVCFKVGLK
jgi:hypothetical protein